MLCHTGTIFDSLKHLIDSQEMGWTWRRSTSWKFHMFLGTPVLVEATKMAMGMSVASGGLGQS